MVSPYASSLGSSLGSIQWFLFMLLVPSFEAWFVLNALSVSREFESWFHMAVSLYAVREFLLDSFGRFWVSLGGSFSSPSQGGTIELSMKYKFSFLRT